MSKSEQENRPSKSEVDSGQGKESSESRNKNSAMQIIEDLNHAHDLYGEQDYHVQTEKIQFDEVGESKYQQMAKNKLAIQNQFKFVKDIGGNQNFQINQQQLLLFKNICLLKQNRQKMKGGSQEEQINNKSDMELQKYKQQKFNQTKFQTIFQSTFYQQKPTLQQRWTQHQKSTQQKKSRQQILLNQQLIRNFLPKILQRSIY